MSRSLDLGDSVAQWLAHLTCGLAWVQSQPQLMLQLPWESNLPRFSSVHPSAKWVPFHRQFKCMIIGNLHLTGCYTVSVML